MKDKDKHKLSLNSESLHDLALFGQVLSLPPSLLLTIITPASSLPVVLRLWRRFSLTPIPLPKRTRASFCLTAILRFRPTPSPSLLRGS
jgi:hypothetical protein